MITKDGTLIRTIYKVAGFPTDKTLGDNILDFQVNELGRAKEIYNNFFDNTKQRDIQRVQIREKILFSSFDGKPHIVNGKKVKQIKSL